MFVIVTSKLMWDSRESRDGAPPLVISFWGSYFKNNPDLAARCFPTETDFRTILYLTGSQELKPVYISGATLF